MIREGLCHQILQVLQRILQPLQHGQLLFPLSFGYLKYTKALLYDSAADMHCSKREPFGGTPNAFLSTVTACANSYILTLFLTHCRLLENVCCPWAMVSETEQCWETYYRQPDCIGLLSQLYCDFFMKLEYYISLSSSVFNSLCKMEFCCLLSPLTCIQKIFNIFYYAQKL